MKKEQVIKIIKEYQADVAQFINDFECEYGTSNLMRAWHDGILAKEGKLTNGIEYELHGIGCRFYLSDREVDFDFGPDSRFDGFDFWRLKEYISYRKNINLKPNYDNLKLIFDQLVEEGVISKPYENSNLFFLKNKH